MRNYTHKKHLIVIVLLTFTQLIYVGAVKAATAPNSETAMTEQDYRNLATWSGVSLDIKVSLTGDKPTYEGKIRLKLDAETSDGPVLLLNTRNVSIKVLEVTVTSTNRTLPNYTVEKSIPNPNQGKGTLTVIHFDSPVTQSTEIEVAYKAEYVAEQGMIFHKPELSFASKYTGWYPSPIADEEELMSIQSVAMPGKITYVVPKRWSALSNGKLVEDKVVGNVKHQTWVSETNVGWSYIAAPYSVSTTTIGDIDVSTYMLNKDPKVAEDKAKMLARLLALLQEKFGPYPYKSFAIAEMPDGTSDYFGGVSEQGFIVAESKNFTHGYGLTLFSHEVGHAWWGNQFGCTGPGSSICSEGLAQIGTILGTELVDGKQAMIDMMDVASEGYTPYQSARGFFAMWRSGDDIPLDQVDGWKVHRLMDSKGMWFWQMLRNEVGDDKFFAVLRSLSDGRMRFSLDELAAYFIDHTKMDLGYFFDQWMRRAGAPVIDMSWEAINPVALDEYRGGGMRETIIFGDKEGPKTIRITLIQEQKELYKLKPEIEIQFYYAPSVIKVVEFDAQKKTFEFELEGMIKDIVLDPEHKILMWRPAYGPKPNLGE